MSKTKTTPLLELLDTRWRTFIEKIADPTHHEPAARPQFKQPQEIARFYEAARLHAEAHASDPFAYGRVVREMRQGFRLPSEVRSDALAVIAARKRSGTVFAINISD